MTCQSACPEGSYLYNGTENNVINPKNICYEKCPKFLFTNGMECVNQGDSKHSENHDTMVCDAIKQSDDWLYILIGCIGGAVALIAAVVVIIYCVKTGSCSKNQYQKVPGGFIHY